MTSNGNTNTADSDKPDASGWSASLYNKNASFVYSSAFTTPVLTLLNAQPGEKIVDFGCGSGELTLDLQKIVRVDEGQGMVVGMDISESMIAKAKSSGVKHAFVCDIQALQIPENFPGEPDLKFDAVFTNAALHWCKKDPSGVLESAKRVLKKGGRFVGEMGGFMNCVGVRSALHDVLKRRGYDPTVLDPWYFPSVEDYTELLKSASFEPIHVSLTPRFTPLVAGLMGWLQLFVRSSFLKDFSDAEAAEVLQEVVDICEVDCKDKTGHWAMMYMRLRFHAVLN